MTNSLFDSGCSCVFSPSLSAHPASWSVLVMGYRLFWNNYQNFCCLSCKSLLGKEGEATGISYSSRDAALVLQSLCWALEPCVPTIGKCFILLPVQPGWEHLSMGWGKDGAKGCFRWRWARGFTWILLGAEQSFILYFFCNLFLPSFAAS